MSSRTSLYKAARHLHTSRLAANESPATQGQVIRRAVDVLSNGPTRSLAERRARSFDDPSNQRTLAANRASDMFLALSRSLRNDSSGDTSAGPSRFRGNTLTAPHQYLPTSLFPNLSTSPSPRGPKPPLIGPPAKLARQIDPFYILETSPLDHDLNPQMARAFIDDMGKIKSRAQTGLTWKNQRAAGKLVRRARAMGIISRWTRKAPVGGLGASMSD